MAVAPKELQSNADYKFGFHDEEDYFFKSRRGLSEDIVRQISAHKSEPEWMTKFRLRAYKHFLNRPTPKWGGNLDEIDFDNIYYYIKPAEAQGKTWGDVPEYIKETFDKLGIPEAERKFLSGVSAQYESEVVYHSILRTWRSRASSSLTWTPGCASTATSSRSTSGQLSRPTTTSSRR